MSTYSIGTCKICKVQDCLKDGICPICEAKNEATDIPDILKQMFGGENND